MGQPGARPRGRPIGYRRTGACPRFAGVPCDARSTGWRGETRCARCASSARTIAARMMDGARCARRRCCCASRLRTGTPVPNGPTPWARPGLPHCPRLGGHHCGTRREWPGTWRAHQRRCPSGRRQRARAGRKGLGRGAPGRGEPRRAAAMAAAVGAAHRLPLYLRIEPSSRSVRQTCTSPELRARSGASGQRTGPIHPRATSPNSCRWSGEHESARRGSASAAEPDGRDRRLQAAPRGRLDIDTRAFEQRRRGMGPAGRRLA